MITIIHGSDTVASRKFFLDQKQTHADALHVEAENVTITDLTQIFEGGGLFGESKSIFIEQILTKRKKSGDFKTLIAYLDQHAAEHAIFLWENKELDMGSLKMFTRATERQFKLPQTLFTLLDSLKPGNGPTLVKLFHQTMEASEPEMIFFMLVRQVRLLLALHPDQPQTESPIDEVKRLTWQKTKMQKQAEAFEIDQLKLLYEKLFAIEKAQKTGTLSAPIPTVIDFLLVEV